MLRSNKCITDGLKSGFSIKPSLWTKTCIEKDLNWLKILWIQNKKFYSLLIFSIRLILVVAFFNCEAAIRAFTHFALFLIAFGCHFHVLFTAVVNFVLFKGFIENVWVYNLRRVTTIFWFILKRTFSFKKFTD